MKVSRFLIILFLSFGFTRSEKIDDLVHLEYNKIDYVSPQLFSFIEKMKQNNNEIKHIVHIGDSHIQIGEFSKGIKKALEKERIAMNDGWFLPSGVFKYVYHPYFKIKHQSHPFETENLKTPNQKFNLGLTGRTFVLNSKENKLKCKSKIPISQLEFLHENTENLKLNFGKCGKNVQFKTTILSKKYAITNIVFLVSCEKFSVEFKNLGEKAIEFYGMRLNHEEEKATYSTFGVSGATFKDFINSKELNSQLEALNPKLILVTLGTNDSYVKNLDSLKFKADLKTFVQNIKENLPESELIFMSAPDTKFKGKKPHYLLFVNREIESICKKSKISFWDWYKIMGGENSIDAWAKAGLTKDYLHFLPKGYQKFGELFAKALLEAKI